MEFEFTKVDKDKQKDYSQFQSYVTIKDEGGKRNADEITDFMYQDFSGLASDKFISELEKRDFINIYIDDTQPTCSRFRDTLNYYDDELESNTAKIMADFDPVRVKEYQHVRSIRVPKQDPTKKYSPKENVKMKLEYTTRYYYKGELLDHTNSEHVSKIRFTLIKAKNEKDFGNGKTFVPLEFKDDTGAIDTIPVNGRDIKISKELVTQVYYRKPAVSKKPSKLPSDCSEEELEKYYGKAVKVSVTDSDELKTYYKNNIYVRFGYIAKKVSISKTPNPLTKIFTIGYQYFIKQIDIIDVGFDRPIAKQWNEYMGISKLTPKHRKKDDEEEEEVAAKKPIEDIDETEEESTKSETKSVKSSSAEEESSSESESDSDSEEPVPAPAPTPAPASKPKRGTK